MKIQAITLIVMFGTTNSFCARALYNYSRQAFQQQLENVDHSTRVEIKGLFAYNHALLIGIHHLNIQKLRFITIATGTSDAEDPVGTIRDGISTEIRKLDAQLSSSHRQILGYRKQIAQLLSRE